MNYAPVNDAIDGKTTKISSIVWLRWLQDLVNYAKTLSTIIDNTGTTSDVLLQPGHIAYVTYSSATSVPLGIKTEDGVYEINILGDSIVTPSADTTYITLSANNTTQSNIGFFGGGLNSSAVYSPYTYVAPNAFRIAKGNIFKASVSVSTQLASKTCTSRAVITTSTYQENMDLCNTWFDSSTAWTSLGTITFPVAQSGKIVVRRII